MPRWLDPDPDSPLVFYENPDGSHKPFARTTALKFGFMPDLVVPSAPAAPAPEAPTVEAPSAPAAAPSGTTAIDQARAKQPPVEAPGAATPAQPSPIPEQGGAPASPLVATLAENTLPTAAPRAFDAPVIPPAAPEVDAISGGELPVEPEPAGGSAPGIGYVPSGPMVDSRPAPPTEPTQQEIDQSAADARVAQLLDTRTKLDDLEGRRQKALADSLADYEKLQQDLAGAVQKSADHKLDPSRKWHNRSTGQKILAIAGAVLAGFGSVINKQGAANPALDLIMGEMDKDLSLQMAERDKLSGDVALKRQQLSDFTGLIDNRQAVFLAERASLLESEARRFDEIAAKAASAQVKPYYQSIAAQMREQALKDAEAAAQTDFENGLKYAKTNADLAKIDAEIGKLQADTAKVWGKVGGGGGGAGEVNAQYATLGEIPKKLQIRAVRLPEDMGGGYVIASDRESAKIAREKLSKVGPVVATIDRALSKVAGGRDFLDKLKGKVGWDPKETQVVKQELSQLTMVAKEYYNLGAISGADLDLMEQLGADVNAVNGLNEQLWARLVNWREGVAANVRESLQPYGIDVSLGAFGGAPQMAKEPTEEDADAILTSDAVENSDGSFSLTSAENLNGIVDQKIQAAKRKGKSDDDIKTELDRLQERSRERWGGVRKARDVAKVDLVKATKKKDAAEIARLQKVIKSADAQIAEYQAHDEYMASIRSGYDTQQRVRKSEEPSYAAEKKYQEKVPVETRVQAKKENVERKGREAREAAKAKEKSDATPGPVPITGKIPKTVEDAVRVRADIDDYKRRMRKRREERDRKRAEEKKGK